MFTREDQLPPGTEILDDRMELRPRTPLLDEVMTMCSVLRGRLTKESKEFLYRKVHAFRAAHMEDFSCGKAIRRSIRSIGQTFIPADLDEKSEAFLSDLIVQSNAQ
jgi:hypothetical protein